jgi:molybdenum cofactor guanylyltransferase
MRLLGAIIAGGQSKRFGSDKAAVLLDGQALIDHVADGLRPQVDALIVCGREWPGIPSIADRPAPNMGPLGGLCAALHFAKGEGFDAVITAGCDVQPVPVFTLAPGVIAGQYLFGLWPIALAEALDQHLAVETNLSLRHWIKICGIAEIASETRFHNLNTPDDLKRYRQSVSRPR